MKARRGSTGRWLSEAAREAGAFEIELTRARRAPRTRRLATSLVFAISGMLVKVLTGVFDPPPDHVSVPWGYVGALVALTLAAVAAASAITVRTLRRPAVDELRDL